MYEFITMEGIETVISLPKSCTPDFTKTGKLKVSCGNIWVDINGIKGPNKFGKDILGLYLINYDGTLYPLYGQEYATFYNKTNYYWGNTSTYCGATGINPDMSSVNGLGCTARMMENSWRIDYW